MVKEVKNLTNIKLTESEDGIWLHFEAKGLKASVNLSLSGLYSGDITTRAIGAWAREQLDKQDARLRRFYLHPEMPKEPVRPSPPVEGGY